MADQVNGKIDDFVEYKKAVLRDNRRDSRIRTSIEATLDYFSSKRKSTFIKHPNHNTIPEDEENEINAAGTARKHSSMAYMHPPRLTHSYLNGDRHDPRLAPGPQMGLTTMPSNSDYKYMTDSWTELKADKDLERQADKADNGKGTHDHHGHSEVDPALVTWRIRLKHTTFAWFACTMSTGGVAFVLSVVPGDFPVLTTIGTVLFLINIFLFLTFTSVMITRFVMHPGTLTHALTNPHEGFFFATFWLSIATMITNSTAYGIPNTGPWLIDALRVAFWIYTACATLLAIFYYHVLFMVKKLVITNVLPGWLLPIFPAMLVGTLASAIAGTQPPEHALPMLVAGLSYQGLGMTLAVMVYGIYIGRLLTSGLPIDMSRPAMFIAVGPPSFTALALIGMAEDVARVRIFSGFATLPGIQNQELVYDLFQLLALLTAIGLWMLAFWFFAISVIAALEAIQRNNFHLNWYAYVFPNVGFTIATIRIGEKLDSNAISVAGTGMAGILTFLWMLIVFAHIKAFRNRMICWPGKDEDAH